ncbi:MAG: hypothetical protein LBT46_01725 [Planctomycetaceae bacterium]|nr:hypothetical protein [Planctomycetaceae bacterium]
MREITARFTEKESSFLSGKVDESCFGGVRKGICEGSTEFSRTSLICSAMCVSPVNYDSPKLRLTAVKK